ncbi:hypothetical protein A2Z33_03105 [Candidatus Gottesmanbacteria bacterium RBG_16_52_11]|uniref:Polymerase nucleotidyl transferase domain-containing protein n=1 Tax=Candidatus Gottesmanbacteria bacterium RBG_16_52_11 TaxID=1798374 RepID=A0A1F5YVJ1_9BACT|nr:MAG: hypothetical protein A2Z33_03105 [Candidatus Gottesmanbacteria bacterium RBG_16_52_11]
MNSKMRQAVIATLSYADVFDYPLTRDEIALWIIGRPIPEKILSVLLPEKDIQSGRRALYHLSGRQRIVRLRSERQSVSRMKRGEAYRVAGWLVRLPTVLLVGITGGLAMNNARPEDDIDLIIIARQGTVWTTRILVTLMVELVARRRRPADTDVADKICLNMFLSEDFLAMPSSDRDLYGAHEVLQLQPLATRGRVYRRFLDINSWVSGLLPVAWSVLRVRTSSVNGTHSASAGIAGSLFIPVARALETIARTLQQRYMRNRLTTEIVNDSTIRFHPHDARRFVRRELMKRLRRYSIPLDKSLMGL